MTDVRKYIIKRTNTIRQALVVLNNLSSDALTLFVVNEYEQMVGTVTDGDIRRHLIAGASLDDVVEFAAHKEFAYVEIGQVDVTRIHEYKRKGIMLIPCLDDGKHIVQIYNMKQLHSILPIDAVLMAGGKGERLRPLTEKTPKPLLPVGNKAIIDYNVDRLISFGIKHISVTVNYLHEQIEEHFKQEINGVKISCVCEPKYLGTIGSVCFVETFHNDTILVMNSDLFTNIDYEDFYLYFEEHNADMAVAAVPYSVSVPYGIFELTGREIQGVKEKPTYDYYANAGIYLIKKELLKIIPENTFFNATDFMEMLIKEKKKVVRFPITGYWIDIGKHEEYNKAQELVKHIKG